MRKKNHAPLGRLKKASEEGRSPAIDLKISSDIENQAKIMPFVCLARRKNGSFFVEG
jgi:hypothetical protein